MKLIDCILGLLVATPIAVLITAAIVVNQVAARPDVGPPAVLGPIAPLVPPPSLDKNGRVPLVHCHDSGGRVENGKCVWHPKCKAAPKVSQEARDHLALALNIYYEARGEPLAGQFAVAEVTLKRVRERGSSVHREVYRPGQFSWTEQPHGRAHGAAWVQAQQVAKAALLKEAAGIPPFVDATHYHADHVRPAWARSMTRVATIGAHHFYRRDA